MAVPTIKIVFRKDKMNDKNIAPIYLRIIKDRNVSYIATGVRLSLAEWDFETNKCNRKHPNSVRINNLLMALEIKYTDEILKTQTANFKINSRELRQAIRGKDDVSFFTVADELLSKYKAQSIGTFHKVQSIVNKLKAFVQKEILMFEEITVRFIRGYEFYAIRQLKNKRNTINKDLRFIKRVFNYAIEQDLIQDNVNPFNKIILHDEPTNRGYLNPEEIQLLENFEGSDLENKVRDISLFQYYSGGIRISDVLLLRWVDINQDRICIKIKKTGKQLDHLLSANSIAILKRHQPLKIFDDSLIFGFLNKAVNMEDDIEKDNYISNNTALINKYLKIIARKVGINKRVSSHIFRHSFAINALQKGISIDVLKEILKHSNVRETQIYAKVQSNMVDEALKQFSEI